MSQHLPENVADWPTDAYALLGVEKGADAKTIRKAYVRLIRKFKPEQNPDEFQRIRAAYESTSGTGNSQDSGFGGFRSAASMSCTDSNQHSKYTKEADEAWRIARNGDFTEAIGKLESILSAQPDDEYVLCRLYWVRKLNPAETEEAIFSWLCRMASRSSDASHVWELLSVESSHSRTDLLSDQYGDLLGTNAALPHLNWLLNRRWREAVKQQAWNQITADVDNIGKRHPSAKTDTACMAAMYSLRFLLWADAKNKHEFTHVLELIGQWSKWLTEEDDEQIRAYMVYQKEWLRCWLPKIVTQVIRETLTSENEEGYCRARAELLEQFTRSPRKWLKRLDQLELKHPLVMLWLCRCMASGEPPAIGPGRHGVLNSLLDKFFWENSPSEYARARVNLVAFCLRQNVHPYQIAEKLLGDQELSQHVHQTVHGRFGELMMVDRPIHCLYFGIAEFQAMMA